MDERFHGNAPIENPKPKVHKQKTFPAGLMALYGLPVGINPDRHISAVVS